MVSIDGAVAPELDTPRLRRAVRQIRRRALGLLGSLWLLLTAGFLMIHLVPGDPVRGALGRNVAEELVQQRRTELGLNDPLFTQYLRFLWDVPRGSSASRSTPVRASR